MAKKSGLGRGLESLLGEAAGEVAPGSDGVKEISLRDVSVNQDQPRKHFDQESLDELTDSIKRNGVLQPILLRPYLGGYQVVAGERRYQAAVAAGLETIPAVVRDIDDALVLQLALIENLQREDLNPMEEAYGYQTLMSQNGLTQAQLAEVLSKSRPAIANALRLTGLPEEVQRMVAVGQLTAGHARAILSVEGDQERIALARKVIERHLTVRQTENVASTISGKTGQSKASRAVPNNAAYTEAATRLTDELGTKVSVKSSRGKKRIEIEFSSEEEFQRLVDRLSPHEVVGIVDADEIRA